MKFGKRLRDQEEGTLPGWRGKFLRYKELKKRLKTISSESPERELEGAEHPLDLCDGSSDSIVRRALLSGPSEDPFVQLLLSELDRFNDFFADKEEEFVIRMHTIKQRIANEVPQRSAPDGTLQGFLLDAADSAGVNCIRRAIVALHGEMVLLENYSSLNYMGLVKIVKKHDKRTSHPLRPFLRTVLQQPFCTTELLSQLISECEVLLQQLLPPSEQSSCNHPVIPLHQDIPSAALQPSSPPLPTVVSAAEESPVAPAGSPEEAAAADFVSDDTDSVAMVYRSACSALRALIEIRSSSKTPHPIMLAAQQAALSPAVHSASVSEEPLLPQASQSNRGDAQGDAEVMGSGGESSCSTERGSALVTLEKAAGVHRGLERELDVGSREQFQTVGQS
ncbi:hypothetical protein CLOM_g21079 [Closterium sp. NIES-68]|nr:hypothetical protein CLOM_g21079 [Closterium sp. NIES-68]GJP75832.1 hypothetical protein CLOP_g6231 [Closterium sp. NIES-67]